jgi:hypothetical protein
MSESHHSDIDFWERLGDQLTDSKLVVDVFIDGHP